MNYHKDGTIATTTTPARSGRPDPDGGFGGATKKPPRSSQRANWNVLFAGFLVMAVTACGLSVLTGSMVLPATHVEHNMDHSENHPSFNAPKLKRESHNRAHVAQFRNAYQRHQEEAIEKYVREHPAKPNEAQHHEPEAHAARPQAYHMVFSTSCSPFQNWQALAFFYFARKVRQPGTVTRLVSGCTDEQTAALRKVHAERVVPMALEGIQTFEMHVTPSFDDSKGGDQKYFNKPCGLLHWMEESLGFKNDGSAHAEDDSVIIVVDPDMMLLRPITKDFSSVNYRGGWIDTPNTRDHVEKKESPVDYESDVVTHGRPHAQQYGFGDGWIKALRRKNATEKVVGPDSPALDISLEDARDYYPAGPPYVATAKDMYQIVFHWVKFLPKYHEFFDGMMCEMHSYSLAAAHLKLPHKLASAFMVSDYESDENLSFIDGRMTLANSCMEPPKLQPAGVPMDPADSRTATDPAYEAVGLPIRDLPFVLHYCQRYALGRYFFSKYKLREDVFDTCEAPLMIEPPKDVALVYDWNMFPNGIEFHDFVHDPDAGEMKNRNKPLWHKRNSWFLCAVIFGVNEAITAYKTASCGTDESYFQKTYHFHEDKAFRKALEDPSNPFQKLKKEGKPVVPLESDDEQ